MPIFEYACPRCRTIYSFLSRSLQPEGRPRCPKCGSTRLRRQMSGFAAIRGGKAAAGEGEGAGGGAEGDMPDMDDPKLMRAMGELEREMEGMDENNPRHMAHIMRKMKDLMPPGSMPKELDIAIKRLEAGEDPEKIEEDMGDVFGDLMGGEEGGSGGGGGGYSRDSGLYDF